jgi:protein TonB
MGTFISSSGVYSNRTHSSQMRTGFRTFGGCFMFEDSLFESQHHAPSARSGWTTAASITLQALLASLLILLPLLHPELLPKQVHALMLTPPPHVEPPPTVTQRVSNGLASIVPALGRVLQAPPIIPNSIDTSPAPDASLTSFTGMTTGTFNDALGTAARGTPVVVTQAPERKAPPVRVSAGVSAGLLLVPIRPIYPAIAKAAGVGGAVVVEAVISKAGTIESLHVVSGPAMLQSAAIEAIRAARYQPFQLNGVPTQVQTTITVNFRIGG